jgi:hypothetical protein
MPSSLPERMDAALEFCSQHLVRVDFYSSAVSASYRVSTQKGPGRVTARGADFLTAIESLRDKDPERDMKPSRSDGHRKKRR